MFSLHVFSHFTNVPLPLILKCIEKRWHHICKWTKFHYKNSKKALNELLMNSTYSQFYNKYYKQIYGTPMGSPISSTISDIVMKDLEISCLSQIDFHIPIYLRYVDDTFLIIPANEIQLLVTLFNSYDGRLSFTYEIENNNSLSFLNINLVRNESHLLTNWYRKKTDSGRYLNYHSKIPIYQKVTVIKSLTDYAILLADTKFHHNNLKTAHDSLLLNKYPPQFITKDINKRSLEIRNRNNNKLDINKVTELIKSVVSFLYYGDLSENIKRLFKDINVRTVFRSESKLNTFIKTGKDPLQYLNKKNVGLDTQRSGSVPFFTENFFKN